MSAYKPEARWHILQCTTCKQEFRFHRKKKYCSVQCRPSSRAHRDLVFSVCIRCRIEFESPSHHRRYCRECRDATNREMQAAAQRKKRARRRGRLAPIHCKGCKIWFSPIHKSIVYCRSGCKKPSERPSIDPARSSVRVCARCDTPFGTDNPARKYCTDRCAYDAQSAYRREYNRSRPPGRNFSDDRRACRWCENEIPTDRSQSPYCTDECKKNGYRENRRKSGRRSNARRQGQAIDPLMKACDCCDTKFIVRGAQVRCSDCRYVLSGVSFGWRRAEQYKLWLRDEGHCYLCKEPVSFSAMEVGHVHPRSQGGSNSKDNLKTTCHRCNQLKRGNEPTDAVIEKIKAAIEVDSKADAILRRVLARGTSTPKRHR